MERSGGGPALEALLIEGYGRAYRTAYLIMRNPADAEEAVQEAFLRVWRSGTSCPIIEVEATGDGGLGGAWDDARRRFGDNVETIVSWSGSAAVALAIGLAALLLIRVVWVGMRRRLV